MEQDLISSPKTAQEQDNTLFEMFQGQADNQEPALFDIPEKENASVKNEAENKATALKKSKKKRKTTQEPVDESEKEPAEKTNKESTEKPAEESAKKELTAEAAEKKQENNSETKETTKATETAGAIEMVEATETSDAAGFGKKAGFSDEKDLVSDIFSDSRKSAESVKRNKTKKENGEKLTQPTPTAAELAEKEENLPNLQAEKQAEVFQTRENAFPSENISEDSLFQTDITQSKRENTPVGPISVDEGEDKGTPKSDPKEELPILQAKTLQKTDNQTTERLTSASLPKEQTMEEQADTQQAENKRAAEESPVSDQTEKVGTTPEESISPAGGQPTPKKAIKTTDTENMPDEKETGKTDKEITVPSSVSGQTEKIEPIPSENISLADEQPTEEPQTQEMASLSTLKEESSLTVEKQEKPKAYQVLARKYRPKTFDDLIGQETLVRTLSNAIETNRLAQAYILTGIRGTGKTTSARLIAKALNCVGPDGKGGMTITPCGKCKHCLEIAADSDMDVIEIDAASNTGVDNVREIIEGARYNPISARYKIYIIDEVHMLSKAAFNALLKTLEEPPERVKFIFATTEIRKVPVTVLSRCQRFDLRRIEPDVLSSYFETILQKENRKAEPEALKLIARAADGSVRDGLSLLDQALAHADNEGTVTAEQVRSMIGLADRGSLFDLFDSLMKGEISNSLNLLSEQYALGADPTTLVQDLLSLTHWLTRVKIAPELAADPSLSDLEKNKGLQMAQNLPMGALTQVWQMLLKGLSELKNSFSPLKTVEMLFIRIGYASGLPSVSSLVEEIKKKSLINEDASSERTNGKNISGNGKMTPAEGFSATGKEVSGSGRTVFPGNGPPTEGKMEPRENGRPMTAGNEQPVPNSATDVFSSAKAASSKTESEQTSSLKKDLNAGENIHSSLPPQFLKEKGKEAAPSSSSSAAFSEQANASASGTDAGRKTEKGETASGSFSSLAEMVDFLRKNGQMMLAFRVEAHIRLVRLSQGVLEYQLTGEADHSFIPSLKSFLEQKTGISWTFKENTVARAGSTLKEQKKQKESDLKESLAQNETVRAVLSSFAGTQIDNIKPRESEESVEAESSEEDMYISSHAAASFAGGDEDDS